MFHLRSPAMQSFYSMYNLCLTFQQAPTSQDKGAYHVGKANGGDRREELRGVAQWVLDKISKLPWWILFRAEWRTCYPHVP